MRRLMQKQLLPFLLLFIGFSAFGQLTVNPDPIEFQADVTKADNELDFHVKNEGTDPVDIFWTLEADRAPSEWQFQICDCNVCYLPGTLTVPCSQPACTINPGEEILLIVHILPNGVEGEATMNFRVQPECGSENSLLEIPMVVNVGEVNSTENEALDNNLSIFPNPTTNIFSIKDDAHVSQIALYNIIGKKIKTITHRAGQSHDISSLTKGIYLVRMFDNSQNVLKVLRLTKD